MTEQKPKRLGAGGWFILLVLGALLLGSIVFAVQVWTSIDVALTPWDWAMLTGGVVLSIIVGVGLMALMFYSARHDYDR